MLYICYIYISDRIQAQYLDMYLGSQVVCFISFIKWLFPSTTALLIKQYFLREKIFIHWKHHALWKNQDKQPEEIIYVSALQTFCDQNQFLNDT